VWHSSPRQLVSSVSVHGIYLKRGSDYSRTNRNTDRGGHEAHSGHTKLGGRVDVVRGDGHGVGRELN
jgi:hypothetical protein